MWRVWRSCPQSSLQMLNIVLVTACLLTLPLVECPCLFSLLPEGTQWCLIRVCEINGFLSKKPWFKKQENGQKGGENQYRWRGKEFLRVCRLFSHKQLLRDYGGVAQARTKVSGFSVVGGLQEGYLGKVHLNGVGCLGTASHRS